jgi:hypothetical protein
LIDTLARFATLDSAPSGDLLLRFDPRYENLLRRMNCPASASR